MRRRIAVDAVNVSFRSRVSIISQDVFNGSDSRNILKRSHCSEKTYQAKRRSYGIGFKGIP